VLPREWAAVRAGNLPPVRVVRPTVALLLATLAALPACSGGGEPAPTATSRPAAGRPTATPTPTGTASALAQVPVQLVPACERAVCVPIAVLADVRPGVSVALVRGPDAANQLHQTAYLLSLGAAGNRLGVQRLLRGDFFFDALPRLLCDQLVHCFVTASSGAHTGVMNVVAVDSAGDLSDISQGGALSVDTLDLRAADLDEDGGAEILGRINDYVPNYAAGGEYWMVWTWMGTRYAPSGCRKVQPGEEAPGGPVTLSGCPR
jgi:hypothetical protein